MRDGAHGLLSRQDIDAKLLPQCPPRRLAGGPHRIDAALARARTIYDGRFDLFGIASVMQLATQSARCQATSFIATSSRV
jgi:hypothetical protein